MFVTRRGDGDACEICDDGGCVVAISSGDGLGRPEGKCMIRGDAGAIEEDLPRLDCCFRNVAGDSGFVSGRKAGELFGRATRTGPADRGTVVVNPLVTRSTVVLRLMDGLRAFRAGLLASIRVDGFINGVCEP